MTFNPHKPATLGVETFPRYKASWPIDSPASAGAAEWLEADGIELLHVWVFCSGVTAPGVNAQSGWELEIYDKADLGTTDLITQVFRPTRDMPDFVKGPVFGYSPFEDPQTFTTPNLWRALDSVSLNPSIWPNTGGPIDNDQLVFPILVPGLTNNGYEAAVGFGTIGSNLNNKRITKVSVCATVAEYVGSEFVAGMVVTPFIVINNHRYLGPTFTTNGDGPHEIKADFYYNPETRISWKVPEVRGLGGGGSDYGGAGWLVNPTGTANNLATLLQGWLEVQYSTVDDPRLAYGPLEGTQPTPHDGWMRIPLFPVANTGFPVEGDQGWTPQAGHEYLAVIRQRAGNGRLSWRYIDPGTDIDQTAPVGIDSPDTVWTNNGYVLDHVAAPMTKLFAFCLNRSGVGFPFVPDLQPYAMINDDIDPKLGLADILTKVDADTQLSQTFTTGDTDNPVDYQWVRFLAMGWDGQQPVAPLVVKVVDTDDDSQVGGTLTFQPSDLSRPPDEWRALEGLLSAPAPLESEHLYRLEFSSTAVAGRGWRVQVLSATPFRPVLSSPPANLQNSTLGGTTVCIEINGVAKTYADAAATIATAPEPPTAPVASEIVDSECIHHARFSWIGTTVPDDDGSGGFLRYEVERATERLPFQRIGNIYDEAVVSLDHGCCPRNEEIRFRVRVRRVDWSASAWTEEAAVTVGMPCCGYIVTTDFDLDLTLWAEDIGADRVSRAPETQVTQRYEGRDFAVVYHQIEYQGLTFDRTLALAGKGFFDATLPTTTPGMRTFDPLLNLRQSRGNGVPYLCLVNQDGDMWLISMLLDDLTQSEPSGTYTALVHFTEVASTPTPMDVAL